MVVQRGDELDETAGIGEENDGLMELQIFPGVALDVFLPERFLEAFYAGFQLGQAGRGYSFRRQARRQPFQVLPDQEEFVHVPGGELDDKGSPLGEDLYQPFLLQPVDGLPDGSTADPQGLGQGPSFSFPPGATCPSRMIRFNSW